MDTNPPPEQPDTETPPVLGEHAPVVPDPSLQLPPNNSTEAVSLPPPEDPRTDKAVDDILKREGDAELKAQDEAAVPVSMKTSWAQKIKGALSGWWGDRRKRYASLAVLVAAIAVVFIVPISRYTVLGWLLKSQASVKVLDSQTHTPVSGVRVELGGQTALTEANGVAVLPVRPGKKTLTADKPFYHGYNHAELITLSKTRNHFQATLIATGRQVQLKLVDTVTGGPIAGATVAIGSAKTKTRDNGLATVVISSGATTQPITVGAGGYNSAPATLRAGGTLTQNTFHLSPAGKLYFLSNLSGKIDVVKANLDGSARQTVLAGTGNEDPRTTSLLASRDWKYLALLSKRAGNYASLSLIDTTNGDKLTTIDQGNVDFSLVGWSDDNFVYQLTRQDVSDWQPNQQALKSYDAASGKMTLLDQTQGSGSNQADFVKQSFGSPYILGDQIVYAKNWTASYMAGGQLNGKSAELDTIGADGAGHHAVKSFSLDSGTQNSYVGITTKLYEPDGLYIYFPSGTQDTFYKYDNGTVAPTTDVNATNFFQTDYPTYLLSPSGNSTFWSEQRDGKNTLFTGGTDGDGQKQIASLSDYGPYGWYSDKYVLVSKNSSELYIMSSSGGTPLKITDYYKPPITYNGYGGGYGGL